jgi:hypothetical protein
LLDYQRAGVNRQRLGLTGADLSGNDVSTWLDGLKAGAGRAQARLKSIGVPVA